MSWKPLKISAILIVAFAAMVWLRSNGRHGFDIRSVVPFMRGTVTVYDFGGLALAAFACWRLARLGAADGHAASPTPSKRSPLARVRWNLFLVPATFAFAAWLGQGLTPALSWDNVLGALRVEREPATQLATLGVLLCAGAALHRVARA